MIDADPQQRLIGVVGPCGSGKSSLVAGLESRGYHCRHIAQEHSHVQAMWRITGNPDVLIYLTSSFETSTARRGLTWRRADYDEELRRLEHARRHAHLVIETDCLTIGDVLSRVVALLEDHLSNG